MIPLRAIYVMKKVNLYMISQPSIDYEQPLTVASV